MRIKKVPPSPGPLQPAGEKFYKDICKYLIDNDLMQSIDSVLVYQAAIWWQVYLISVKNMGEKGTKVIYKTGAEQVSPDVSNMLKASNTLKQLLDKLGIGEEARMRLKMGSGGEGVDPMDKL